MVFFFVLYNVNPIECKYINTISTFRFLCKFSWDLKKVWINLLFSSFKHGRSEQQIYDLKFLKLKYISGQQKCI